MLNKLRDHYDGPSMRKRSTIAKKRIEQLNSKNEATFKFETYCPKLKQAFDTIHKGDCPIEDKERNDLLIGGIQCTAMTAPISNLRMNLTSWLVQPVFTTVAGILSKEVTELVAAFELKAGMKRNVSEINTNDRGSGGCGQGRFGNRGGGRENRNNQNFGTIGVDASDPNRNFSQV